MITSTNKPLHNTTIMPIFNWWLIFKSQIIVFLIVLALPLFSSAQKVKMIVNFVTPAWNDTKVCDAGNGFNPDPMIAPSISYSSSDPNAIQDAKYDYTWKQKLNNEEWQTVSSGKSVNFIPAYNPPLLFNKLVGSPIKNYSYQLIIKDLANGGQEFKSEIFSFALASEVSVNYKVSSSNTSRNKFSIQLGANGGFSSKQYTWSSSRSISIPQNMVHVENPDGLEKGTYIVEIKDMICPLKTETIIVDETTKSDGK